MPKQSTEVTAQHVVVAKNRHSQLLTFEYIFALGASVVAAILSCVVLSALFSLWNGDTVQIAAPFSWFMNVSDGYVGTVIVAIGAVLLSLLAVALFARVSHAVVHRPNYTRRLAYKLTTYGAFAVLCTQFLIFCVTIVGIIVTSLVLLGAQSSLSSLYLQEFLPALIGAAIVGVAGYYMYLIVKGSNKSRTLALFLLGISVALLIIVLVTVAVRSHDQYSPNDYGQSTSANPVMINPPYSIY